MITYNLWKNKKYDDKIELLSKQKDHSKNVEIDN